jgi:DNA replication protein DnaD
MFFTTKIFQVKEVKKMALAATNVNEAAAFPVPNALMDLNIAEINPVYFLIYVYALSCARRGRRELSNAQIAADLNVSAKDVTNAFAFFMSKGLVRIPNFRALDDADFDVEFLSGENIAPSPPREPVPPSYASAEIARILGDNNEARQMRAKVESLLGKGLSSAETQKLCQIYDYIGLSASVILILVEYMVSKGKKSWRVIEKEAIEWAGAGVDSVKKANAYIARKETLAGYEAQTQRLIGAQSRALTGREKGFFKDWQEKDFSMELLRAAYEETVNRLGDFKIAYMNKILLNWREKGAEKPEAASEVQKERREAQGKKTEAGRYDFDAIRQKAFEKQLSSLKEVGQA